MRIPLLYVKDNVRDWILVELQGSFHLNEDSTAQNLQRIEEKVYLGGINIGEMSVNWEEVSFLLDAHPPTHLWYISKCNHRLGNRQTESRKLFTTR